MELVGDRLQLGSEILELANCTVAYMASSKIHQTRHVGEYEELDEADTVKVLRGFAKIALNEYGNVFHGLHSTEADAIISELIPLFDGDCFPEEWVQGTKK